MEIAVIMLMFKLVQLTVLVSFVFRGRLCVMLILL
ncbi:unnamed protein product [Brassica rapa subsp. narinosa]|uniref:(rape) hypothetical protein n=1 Tax=Brassica napus TaxID=3708 RepID=A0A816PSQ6_BRANA|nr:unnamed protein product [Brassica napus]